MKIHNVIQGSEDWLKLRTQYFTGSALGEWLLDGDRTKTSRKAWSNAIWEVGFISHDCEGFGVSPDGLVPTHCPVGWSHGLELKCPVARTMLRWLDAGTLPDEHKLQVHASMAASGLQRWDFFAWHPELVPLHLIVERDEFTEQVLAGLLKLSDDYSAAKAKLAGWIATPTAETP